jgi:hypothetical protein
MASKKFFFTELHAGQVSGHFHFKASNKEPDDQMDMVLYPPDEETTSRKSAKTLIHILYGNTNIPSRQSRNLFRKRIWLAPFLEGAD